MSANAEKTAMA